MRIPPSFHCPRAAGMQILSVIRDFRDYLEHSRHVPGFQAGLSDRSRHILAQWRHRTGSAGKEPFQKYGSPDARLMVIDSESTFFDGAAGELLANILKAINLTTDQVFICNAADTGQCLTLIAENRPEAVLIIGESGTRRILDVTDPFHTLRGRFHSVDASRVMPTFHPKALLADPAKKRAVWEDMKKVMALLEGQDDSGPVH